MLTILKNHCIAHAKGLACIFILTGFFFFTAFGLSETRVTLIDMRGFGLTPEVLKAKEIHKLLGNINQVEISIIETQQITTIKDCQLLLDNIENNFKKLSFNLYLSELARKPGYIGFYKDLNLRGRFDPEYLYFFISAKTDNQAILEILPFLYVKVYLDDELAWTSPAIEIGNPTFIEQSIVHLTGSDYKVISLFCGFEKTLTGEEQRAIMNESIEISLEYLDIR